MKLRETFSYLIDENKPLLPQLRKVKRACFTPYLSDLQLIHHRCEKCSEESRYGKCNFYEATHLACFGKNLEEILKNDAIHKPKQFHPQAERLCYGRIALEKILKGAWPLIQHGTAEPRWLGTDEHRKWNKRKKGLQQDLPCESTCKMAEWCAFYQNDFERKLCLTTIKEYDEDTVYFNTKHSFDEDRGYRIGSYLYKTFIKPSITKELPPVKTDFGFKKLDDWHYKIYEKIYKAVVPQKKHKIILSKAIIDSSINEKTEEEFLTKVKPFMGFDYQKLRSLAQRHKKGLTETSSQLIEIDFAFWKEYVKQQHLDFQDVLYCYYLMQETNPSRQELENKFNISQPTQIIIEKRLGIRKDFRNRGKTQMTNEYLTNPYIIGAIFRILNRQETKEKLKEIRKRNKEKINKEKLYNHKGQVKLSNKQLKELNQLHKELNA